MLKIYDVILEVLRMLAPVIKAIEVHDRDLARQLRRASTSVALNTKEGSGSRGGTRRQRYDDARASAEESEGILDSAVAMQYVESIDPVPIDKLDHVRATLWNLTH